MSVFVLFEFHNLNTIWYKKKIDKYILTFWKIIQIISKKNYTKILSNEVLIAVFRRSSSDGQWWWGDLPYHTGGWRSASLPQTQGPPTTGGQDTHEWSNLPTDSGNKTQSIQPQNDHIVRLRKLWPVWAWFIRWGKWNLLVIEPWLWVVYNWAIELKLGTILTLYELYWFFQRSLRCTCISKFAATHENLECSQLGFKFPKSIVRTLWNDGKSCK